MEQNDDLIWARKIFKKYLSVRPYFACDYYPLTYKAVDDTTWCDWQYDRPESSDGIVLLFRRPDSPHPEAVIPLNLPPDDRIWLFEDADSGEAFSVSGIETARRCPSDWKRLAAPAFCAIGSATEALAIIEDNLNKILSAYYRFESSCSLMFQEQ